MVGQNPGRWPSGLSALDRMATGDDSWYGFVACGASYESRSWASDPSDPSASRYPKSRISARVTGPGGQEAPGLALRTWGGAAEAAAAGKGSGEGAQVEPRDPSPQPAKSPAVTSTQGVRTRLALQEGWAAGRSPFDPGRG